jgi:hypothetical protein
MRGMRGATSSLATIASRRKLQMRMALTSRKQEDWIKASVPYQTAELMARFLEGMQKAGLG